MERQWSVASALPSPLRSCFDAYIRLFLEPLDVALDRLFHRFPQLSSSLQKAVKEIREISDLAVKLGVKRPILFHPFLTHRFFKGGALFECVRAHFKREVLGVGGR